ncbi:hypothetical protein [Acetobacter sp. AAB5]|uniref:hypothetical protein n=1 Tax=Acetobacter sp. AAB5 TaxID=3418370 RepID=UPI003CF4406B
MIRRVVPGRGRGIYSTLICYSHRSECDGFCRPCSAMQRISRTSLHDLNNLLNDFLRLIYAKACFLARNEQKEKQFFDRFCYIRVAERVLDL